MKKYYILCMLLVTLLMQFASAQSTGNCNAQFSFTIHNGNNVQFVPAMPGDSINTQHMWMFGDGTQSAALAPSHIYTNPGSYNVTHIITRFGTGTLICMDTVVKTLQVQGACNLVGAFADSLVSTGSYQFLNYSYGMSANDSIRWTFGDGSSSYQVSPTHTYTQGGTYVVCLRIQKRNTAGALTNCVSEICKTILVHVPGTCNLAANFTFAKETTTPALYDYRFTNTSVGLSSTDSIRWNFGDGNSSNAVNPVHNYAQPGIYVVCLKIIKRNSNGSLSNCMSDKCLTLVIENSNACTLVAGFTFRKDSTTTYPYDYRFTNTSTPLAPTDSIKWSFGDGTFSNAVNPLHAYAQSGTYNVCLRIIKRTTAGTISNCIKEVCHSIVVTNDCNVQPYPNPAGHTVTVDVHLSQPEIIKVYIYNSLNVLMKDKQVQGLAGNNPVAIPIGDLVAGVYGMKVIYGNMVCTTQFIKL